MSRSPHPKSTHGFATDIVAAVLDEALSCPGRPPVFGIAGLQGSGKSTLSAQLVQSGRARGLNVVALSIDDFYLTRRERLALGKQVHPLLATRGPPGTHDVALACRSIDALRKWKWEKWGQSEVSRAKRLSQPVHQAREIHSDPIFPISVRLPRFDKIADRRLPPSRWRVIRDKPDLIVFEGWFLKVPAESARALRQPLNALERDDDATGIWRRYCNDALGGYVPLWQRLDRLLFLQGPGFEVVPTWRWQQEQTLQAANPQRQAMRRSEVERFVLFFERVSRQALRTLPALAERTLRIDARRQLLP
jgi:D-glycerate 3-kinase